ncbi:MAG TPA: hypothetical protein PLZ64_07575, partial [Chitinophagales bacterium]|nr:hypothetical protein [Chitinophagales bacterium]
MELDEYIYGKFVKYFQQRKRVSTAIQNKTAYLDNLKARLTILASTATARPIEIYPSEREGGYKNNSFFLPASFSLFSTFEQNTWFYLYRVLYLATQQKLDYNWKHNEDANASLSSLKAIETAEQVLHVLFEEYPATKKLHD